MKKRMTVRYYVSSCIQILILIGHTACSLAQTPTSIDSFIATTDSLFRNAAFEQTINNSFEILRLSEKINYEKGVIYGYTQVAKCLAFQGKYDKSIEYLRKLRTDARYLAQNPYELWSIQKIELDNLLLMDLHAMAREQLHTTITTISKEKDPLKRVTALFSTYLSAAALLDDDPDTIYYYCNRARYVIGEQVYKLQRQDYYKQDKAALYICLGRYHFSAGYQDSALFYFQSARDLLQQAGGHYYEACAYNGLGMVYQSRQDYSQALEFKLKALEMYQKYHVLVDIEELYREISEIYASVGNKEKEREYLKLHDHLEDSLSRIKAMGSNMTTINLVKANEKRLAQKYSQHRYTIGFMVTGTVLTLCVAYCLFYRFKKRKDKLLREKQELLEESRKALANKDRVLSQLHLQLQASSQELEFTEEENKRLKQKANDTFAELIRMVKDNDAQFWTRFQEVYPSFTALMLSVNPTLKTSELTFCAYIYLGFGTKQIAIHTYKALKTIENNRYNIRKRLGLSPDEDLVLWIQKWVQ